jgi:hypothetical protein
LKIQEILKTLIRRFKFIQYWQKRELWLLILAIIIGLGIIFYLNHVANEIAKREEGQVIIWANEIQQKANLLELSNEIFNIIKTEERIKIQVYAKASQFVTSETNEKKLSMLLDILQLNQNIPTVLVDDQMRILEYKNTEHFTKLTTISKEKNPDFFKFKPIEFDFNGKKQYIYFKESILFDKLKKYTLLSEGAFFEEIQNNLKDIPILIYDQNDSLVSFNYIDEKIVANPLMFKTYQEQFKESRTPIYINFDENAYMIYYKPSGIISILRWLPLLLYATLFVIGYISWVAFKKLNQNEKNLLWVGMSKETAHQLGTPISSLSAWVELLSEKYHDNNHIQDITQELNADIVRLSKIADRFSKIGSKPNLENIELTAFLENAISYMRERIPNSIEFDIQLGMEELYCKINTSLMEWVIENLFKNAYDAIGSQGKISLILDKTKLNQIQIDIIDNGKGMAKEHFETCFEPGFTTKKRGWGLGLSLCKRIIEQYFQGKISVTWSEKGQGTNFRIMLPYSSE